MQAVETARFWNGTSKIAIQYLDNGPSVYAKNTIHTAIYTDS